MENNINIDLRLGDCLELMREIPSESIDMILTDLPYGTTDKNKWDRQIDLSKLFKEYDRIIKNNAAILLYAQQPFATDLINAYRHNFRYEIIWEKTKPVGFFNAKKMPLRSHENILVFYKHLPPYNPKLQDCNKKVKRPNDSGVYGTRRSRDNEYVMKKTGYPRTVVRYANTFTPQLHPTQKNVELNEYLIELFTNKGDFILDSTMGSCSTGIACLNTNRNFIGMELDEGYFNIAKQRVEDRRKELAEKNLFNI